MIKCREEGRVLVTLDNDFSDIITYPPDTTEGIIVFRSKEQGKGAVIKVATNLLQG